jgi:hypothetical protein
MERTVMLTAIKTMMPTIINVFFENM